MTDKPDASNMALLGSGTDTGSFASRSAFHFPSLSLSQLLPRRSKRSAPWTKGTTVHKAIPNAMDKLTFFILRLPTIIAPHAHQAGVLYVWPRIRTQHIDPMRICTQSTTCPAESLANVLTAGHLLHTRYHVDIRNCKLVGI